MERAYRNAESAAVASEPVAKAKPESAPVLGPKPKPQTDVPKVQKVQATVIEPGLESEPSLRPSLSRRPSSPRPMQAPAARNPPARPRPSSAIAPAVCAWAWA